MKLCADDKECPYQSYFDTLYRLEAIDPGLCENFLSQPDSRCLLEPKTKEKPITVTKLAEARDKEKRYQKRVEGELHKVHKKAPLSGGPNPHMTI